MFSQALENLKTLDEQAAERIDFLADVAQLYRQRADAKERDIESLEKNRQETRIVMKKLSDIVG